MFADHRNRVKFNFIFLQGPNPPQCLVQGTTTAPRFPGAIMDIIGTIDTDTHRNPVFLDKVAPRMMATWFGSLPRVRASNPVNRPIRDAFQMSLSIFPSPTIRRRKKNVTKPTKLFP